jgi:hypothetical protein
MKKKVVKKVEAQIIYVDGKNQHLEDETIFAVHPNKLQWLSYFEKESFDQVIVQNTPTSYLKSINFFFMGKILKPNSIVEVFIDQPISVMQALDASEIEANAKLAGFVDIQQHEIEYFVKDGDKDIKIKSLKVSMVRSDKAGDSSTKEAALKGKSK